jgi:hypothetical protein
MTFKEKIKQLSGIHLLPTRFIDHIKAITTGIQYVPASTIKVNFQEDVITTNFAIPNIKCNITTDDQMN